MQADATGALEAVKAAVGALPQDRVAPRFLLAAASDISASDVDLAFASEAVILGFNVEPNEAAQAAAKQFGAVSSPHHAETLALSVCWPCPVLGLFPFLLLAWCWLLQCMHHAAVLPAATCS